MDTSTHQNDGKAPTTGWRLCRVRGLSGWGIFALGFALGLTVVHLGITRPVTRQLARLEGQVVTVEHGIRALAGHAAAAAETTGLLGTLAEQGRRAQAAAEALSQLEAVGDQVLAHRDRTVENTLTEIGRFEQLAEAQSQDIVRARESLEALVALKSRAVEEADNLDRAGAVVDNWVHLNDRIVKSAADSQQARQASEELLALQEVILCASDPNHPERARNVLDELVAIRERLHNEAGQLAAARANLDCLVALKDQVLAQTGDLADAIETLEVAADLNRQFEDAVRSFDRMRRWLAEVILLEPMIERTASALVPLAELGNLRRLSPVELRAAARIVAGQRAAEWTGKAPPAGETPEIGQAAVNPVSQPLEGAKTD